MALMVCEGGEGEFSMVLSLENAPASISHYKNGEMSHDFESHLNVIYMYILSLSYLIVSHILCGRFEVIQHVGRYGRRRNIMKMLFLSDLRES